jgi:hypothetical protein
LILLNASVGFVVDPYLEYQPLLPTILNSLKSGSDMTLRKELVLHSRLILPESNLVHS